MESFALNFAVMLVALVFVLALAWFVLRLLRQRSGFGMTPQGDDALRFVRALPVGAKERVVIIEHNGKRWMLGVTAGSISVINSWPVGDAAPATDESTPTSMPDRGDSVS